ncbi:MAG: glycoside hydrolase family 2 TIM barrel-domain containing protein [Actinomycetota bacterium]|nr:glycoside hydrolase family 2 TIM barrel-domain containing protein [Actinomycetota bacterium]
MINTSRLEYPRPDFVRDSWLSLNGEWDFSFNDDCFDKKINVPFAYQSKLSGLGNTEFHQTVWYRKTFNIPSTMHGDLVLLHFGAVDYSCKVWVNGVFVTGHTGGHTGFYADITNVARFDKSNTIVVKVEDDHSDLEMPRGKQFWEEKPRSIFYAPTTGIWQSVWLEAVPHTHLYSVRMTPLFDEKAIKFDYRLCGAKNIMLETQISFEDTQITSVSVQSQSHKGSFTVRLDQPELLIWNFCEDLAWSPENPRLFNVVFNVYNEGQMTDTVSSYFGMRKVSVENNTFMLNNRPYYQKLILDQGYWPESLMTAPSDEAFIKDIELVKAMGFNGVRKHQKVEDPRFLYHADRMGLLVWSEIGSAYLYSDQYATRMYREWVEALKRDYNHPCIVVWVPLNESWSVQEIQNNVSQQEHSKALYHMTKSLDSSRVVIDNDGWEHTCGDMLTIHDYESSPIVIRDRYASLENILKFLPNGKKLYVGGKQYNNEPIIVSEFGGIRFSQEETKENSWGYSEDKTLDGFVEHLRELVNALRCSRYVQGYCYTQLTDIGTEQNGLLTYRHEPKVSPKIIKDINDGKK